MVNQKELFCFDLKTAPCPENGLVLVTGATGYIGGRLMPELIARGYEVRAMVRGDAKDYAHWWPEADVVGGDALDSASLEVALEGVHTAYYLIHSLVLGQKDFAEADLRAAENFRKAADKQGVKRIIYLGGLSEPTDSLSDHLRSRNEVAEALQCGSIPTTILRASIIIGSGSASYEIIKHLIRSLPVLLIPSWAKNECQPIAIRDVIKYLVGVLELPETAGESYDIGGEKIMTYETMLKIEADAVHKKRWFLPSPWSNNTLYAYIGSLITPVPAPITMCLMRSLKNPTICQENQIREVLPFKMLGYKEAIVRAMSREEQDWVASRWSDAYPPAHELAIKLHELEKDPAYICSYFIDTAQGAAALFDAFCQVGGKSGWFNSNWMWRLRGAMDRVLFGVGIRRGRRSSTQLRVNDVIDFWRVEDLQEDKRLLLRAEMKVPGKAWLEFRISEGSDRKNRLTITAYFDTQTMFGRLYWYTFLPFHGIIFKGLLSQIEKRSSRVRPAEV